MIRAFVVAAGVWSLCGSASAFGQEGVPERYATAEEMRDDGPLASWAEMALCRLGPERPVPDGISASPEPTLAEVSSDLLHAMVDDVRYRLKGEAASTVQDLEPQVVVDGDWVPIVEPQRVPHAAVCYVAVSWPSGGTTGATAFFVSPRVLVTSAHVVYDRSRGGYPDYAIVTAGRKGDTTEFGADISRRFRVPSEWRNEEYRNVGADIGWIILPDRRLHRRIGYTFGFRTSDDAELRSANLNVLSYPKLAGGYMYQDYEKRFQGVDDDWFTHVLDTEKGSSGAPLYKFVDGRRSVLGIHSGPDPRSDRRNIATRMTPRWVKETKFQIDVYDPGF